MSDKKNPYSNFNWYHKLPIHIGLDALTETEKFLLTDSKFFCMVPWIHLHGFPDGKAAPCCIVNPHTAAIGNLKEKSMKEIWNDTPLCKIRNNMLNEKPSSECFRCYEQEKAGFKSMRNGMNREFGHYVKDINKTNLKGQLPDMKIRYWDVRFSNICNLKCRSCGSMFSSRWYDDDIKLHGKPIRPRIMFAGKHEMDIWEQMIEHIPYLEQIYFAGGEPLIMEEHYRILEKLLESKNTTVKLIYNTNLTELRYKQKDVLSYWKQFKHISVAASLDGMGSHLELIRSGSDWSAIEENIVHLKQECPHIDFLVSPTLSIMNVWHIPEFHRTMVNKGYIEPKDLNINPLLGPEIYRIDILPKQFKEEIVELYTKHLSWLERIDPLQRATGGFTSALKLLLAKDNSKYLDDFWKHSAKLDKIRNETIYESIPELKRLLEFDPKFMQIYKENNV